MATLVHDDLIDGARFRRGRAAAWAAYGPDAARAAGDYLFARAFSELAATGDPHAVALLADATLCLARGEALQRRQTHDPDTTVESYLERCELKTAKLFEAACLLGSGGRDPALGRVRARARHRLPDHGRHPRLHGRRARDRQDRRRRPPRGHADAAAAPGRARGRGRPRRARRRAARRRARPRRRHDRARPARARSRSTTPAAPAAASTASSTATSSRLSPTSWCTGTHAMIRLGRISYVNMAPVFYRLDAEVEEVQGVPTDLNRRLVAGEIDLAPISSIEYARNAATLRILPRLCVSSEGAVDSIQLVSRVPARARAHRGGHARERHVRRPDEGAAPRRRRTCRSARRPTRSC